MATKPRGARRLRFVWPFLVIAFVVCCAFLGISAATD
jgi:Na+/proline symporter